VPDPDVSTRAIRTVQSLRPARLAAPASKSLTQRALVIASLCRGRSHLRRPLLGEDGTLLREALGACGLRITATPDGADLEVDGGEAARGAGTALMLGNAGTAMRFLAARLAVEPDPRLLDGGPRMRQRPIEDLLESLRALGMEAEAVRGNGCPPIRVGGGRPRGGAVALSGARSSQFVSALLMATPRFEHGVDVAIQGPLVSRPYVDLTIAMMRRFGVEVRTAPAADPTGAGLAGRFTVAPGGTYRAADVTIEGDWSSASYLFAAAAVVPGRVEVEGLEAASCQGDAGILAILRQMGCRVEAGAGGVVAVEGPERLRAVDADLRDMPDLAPTVAILALFADGPSRIHGVPHLRLKESDRIEALAAGIAALGGEADAAPDGLTIRPRPLQGGTIDPRGDHRMAMAFAVAGLRVPGVVVLDPDCVAKSYPAFWDDFDRLAG
jgi:3-phosphoshikimate 1-carboxyvinyltransferase